MNHVQFAKFDPAAWQEAGLIVEAPAPVPMSKARRTYSLPVVFVLSVSLGLVMTQSLVADAAASDRIVQVAPDSIAAATDVEGEALSQDHVGPDLERRLEELGRLSAGWYDEKLGAPFTSQVLERVGAILKEISTTNDLPFPYLYPSPLGEISAEWTFGDWEIDLTFDPPVERARLLALNGHTHESEEQELPLSAGNATTRIGRFVATRFERAGHV